MPSSFWLYNDSFLYIKYAGFSLLFAYMVGVMYRLTARRSRPASNKASGTIFMAIVALIAAMVAIGAVTATRLVRLEQSFNAKIEETQRNEQAADQTSYLALLDYQDLASAAYSALVEYGDAAVPKPLYSACAQLFRLRAEFYVKKLAVGALIRAYHLEILSTPRFYTEYADSIEPAALGVIDAAHTACNSLNNFRDWLRRETPAAWFRSLRRVFEAGAEEFPTTNRRFHRTMQTILKRITIRRNHLWPIVLAMVGLGSLGVCLNWKFYTMKSRPKAHLYTVIGYYALTFVVITAFAAHFFVMGMLSATIQACDKAVTKPAGRGVGKGLSSNSQELIDQLQAVLKYIENIQELGLDAYTNGLRSLVEEYTTGEKLEYSRPQDTLDAINERLRCQALEVCFTEQTCSHLTGTTCFAMQGQTAADFYGALDACVPLKAYVKFMYKSLEGYLAKERKAMASASSLLNSLAAKSAAVKEEVDAAVRVLYRKIEKFAAFMARAAELNAAAGGSDYTSVASAHVVYFRDQLHDGLLPMLALSLWTCFFLVVAMLGQIVVN